MTTKKVMDFLGSGGKLTVDKKGWPCLWKDGYFYEYQLDVNLIAELGNKIYKLTKNGNPPKIERKSGDGGYRMGWLESGLNGYDYDWYVCMQ